MFGRIGICGAPLDCGAGGGGVGLEEVGGLLLFVVGVGFVEVFPLSIPTLILGLTEGTEETLGACGA